MRIVLKIMLRGKSKASCIWAAFLHLPTHPLSLIIKIIRLSGCVGTAFPGYLDITSKIDVKSALFTTCIINYCGLNEK